MTSSPDLIHELRASRPSAPADLRARVRAIASEQPARAAPWASWRFPVRRGVLVAVPAAAALAFASAGVLGLARSDSRRSRRAERDLASRLEAQTAERGPTTRARSRRRRRARRSARADRAQSVSATLTVEVADSDAVSRAAQDALDLTRSLGGYVVSSSVATGDEGSASITVRVPVDKVQDAIAGLSGLGRIVSQQVTIEDLQQSIDGCQQREPVVGRRSRGSAPGSSPRRSTPRREAVLEARLQRPRGRSSARAGSLESTEAEARMSTIQLTVVTPGAFGAVAPPSRIDRAIDEALNVLAWEGVVALGILIVLAPFALVAFAAWLGRRFLPAARRGSAARDIARRDCTSWSMRRT